MSNAAFYRCALAGDLSAGVRALFESLLSRAARIDGLARSLPDQIRANRERREGGPVSLSKAERRTIRSFEADAERAAAELPSLVASLRPESLLVRTALESERTALRMDRAVHAGGHPEDEALARPLLELRAANIADLEAFGSGRAQQEVTPGGDAGR